MGASLTMIDRHYGHLARDGREHAVLLLDALAQRKRRRRVDAGWTSEAIQPHNALIHSGISKPHRRRIRDARWTLGGRREARCRSRRRQN
jgi:hypothetical protein